MKEIHTELTSLEAEFKRKREGEGESELWSEGERVGGKERQRDCEGGRERNSDSETVWREWGREEVTWRGAHSEMWSGKGRDRETERDLRLSLMRWRDNTDLGWQLIPSHA